MKTKRIIILLISMLFLTACSKNESKDNSAGKINIVCTTFSQYDWIKEIIKGKEDKFELSFILDNNLDLHNYQASAEDILNIKNADFFVYNGGESDEWVDEILDKDTKLKSFNMLETIGDNAKEEEHIEGMQEEENEEHDEVEYDEHVWLSLKNAKIIVEKLSEKIINLDKSNQKTYEKNTLDYLDVLTKLDDEYRDVVDNSEHNTLLFGDRFPFRYLVHDYNLKYYAAFIGCSAQTEASFETITFLSKKVDEIGLNTILVIENSDKKIANTIKENTKNKDQKILTMNSIQSVNEDMIKSGFTYVKAMKSNLEILKKALN